MSNKKWYQKLLENLASARDAKIGAVGADQVRQLYKEGEDEQAKKLAEDYLKANATGIATGIGGAGTLTSISKIGVVPTIISEAGSAAGSYVGSRSLGALGSHIDEKYGTNLAPTLTFTGGLLGGFGGGIGGYKAAPIIIKAGDNAINFTTNTVNDAIIKNAVKKGKLSFIDTPTTYRGFHQSDAPIYEPDFNFERWDVVNHGADKKGMFFTLDSPAKNGFLSKRKYMSQWDVNSGKTLVQNGELKGLLFKKNPIRNRVVKYARDNGADVVLFDGIADNGLQNQRILFATDKAGFDLADHNYYSRLKPISDLDRANIMTGNDLKSAFDKVGRKFPKELSKYLRSVVSEDGTVDVAKLKRGNEEIYKLFEKINAPIRKAEDVTGQRYFSNGRVKSNGNLYDHMLGTAQSAKTNPLPYSPTKPMTRQEMVLLDLYHDQGKMIPNIMDNVAKRKYPMHDEYGYYMGKLYGLDMRSRNAIRGHMTKNVGHNPIHDAVKAHDRLTGATIDEGFSFVKNPKKWLEYKNENYKPAGIYINDDDLGRAAVRSAYTTTTALRAMRGGTKDEMVARSIQNLDAGKEIADIAEMLRKTDPETFAKIQGNIDNPFVLQNLIKTYKTLDGNIVDKLMVLGKGHKQYKGSGLPIVDGVYHGNIKDFLILNYGKQKGYVPTTRYVAGSDEGKQMLFASGDRSNAEIAYVLKTLKHASDKGSYVGKITPKEGTLPVSKELKRDLTKRYIDFMESLDRIKNGTSENVEKDFLTMLQNYPALQNPTLGAKIMRGSESGSYTTSYQKKSFKDVVDYAKQKIDYSSKRKRINFVDEETSELYKSQLIDTESGPVTNQVERYFVKDNGDIIDLAQMDDFGLMKYKKLDNRKALLHSIKDRKEELPNLWNYLNTSGRVSTDGIKKAASLDNPNSVIRARINDFGGISVGGKYPVEVIMDQKNVLTGKQLTSPTVEFTKKVANKFIPKSLNFKLNVQPTYSWPIVTAYNMSESEQFKDGGIINYKNTAIYKIGTKSN